jgi:hypothetical protein
MYGEKMILVSKTPCSTNRRLYVTFVVKFKSLRLRFLPVVLEFCIRKITYMKNVSVSVILKV